MTIPSGRSLLARVSPFQYVAACFLAMVLRPNTFMTVCLAVVIVYHAVLVHAGFLEVIPTTRTPGGGDGHPLLIAYRRAAPALLTAGLLTLFIDVPGLGEQGPGLLIASGTALILAVKMITFAGTDAG